MTTTPSACQNCGAAPREGARFCDSCGASIAPREEPEYKQVTVLFADVVRSMDMAAALGPERLRELMTELVNVSANVVARYGGTLNQFTGDGIMALFGAPVTLEDHAFRACLAAWDIQQEGQRLAAEVSRRDGLDLRLRIGLNSGQVIAGDVGSISVGYTAIGEQVGMAQRMESVAPPGGVMVSESTARLVERLVSLSESQSVRIKGSDEPVSARRLLAAAVQRAEGGRRESRLVGRERESDAISSVVERAIEGSGGVVAVSGPPGIGKSRLVRESVMSAQNRGIDVFTTYCESHTRDIPFHVISRLLRSVFDVEGLAPAESRARVRGALGSVDEQDLLMLDDLLGVCHADVPLPDISADARRRRLADLINAATLQRRRPAVYVIEDVHWIDSISEAMVADVAAVVPLTQSIMLMTHRPEYHGPLCHLSGIESITLDPLDDSRSSQLTFELLGQDPSVAALSALIADRAAGVPLFAEEIVRDLAERGVLIGDHGGYVSGEPVQDIDVPATVQATIGARIDRLDATAKKTLHAASIIGARFAADLLHDLMAGADVTALIDAELVVEAGSPSRTEYGFRHPLIQKVAYESQLKSSRSDLHRRVAGLMQRDKQEVTGAEAAFIATQYQAAGDQLDAIDWHMRAASWFGPRDIRAARGSWELARRIADGLPDDDPNRMALRIAPRALLCGSAFQVGGTPEETGFDELLELTTAAGDKRSLAVGMGGHITTLTFNSRHREAAQKASEFTNLVESIGDPEMTVGLLYAAGQAMWEAGHAIESTRVAQRMIDLARGDPTMGNFLIGSPLAWATMLRGGSRMFLGRKGWRDDIAMGIELTRDFDTNTRALAQLYRYAASTGNGAVLPTAADVEATTAFVQIAQQSGDSTAITFAHINRATALLHSLDGDRAEGMIALSTAREMLVREKLTLTLQRMTEIEFARHWALSGEVDRAIDLTRSVIREQADTGEMIFRGAATTVLVEALLQRRSAADVDDACTAIDQLEAVPTDPGFVLHELPILRLRALLSRARGDEPGYQRFLARFSRKALESDFEGCMAQADAMA